MKQGFFRTHGLELGIGTAIVLIALAAFLLLHNPFSVASAAEEGPYAVIQSTAGDYFAAPLSQDAEFSLTSATGINHVVIVNGAVSIDKADCKNQICVETGAINRVGDTIVCLPHQVVVQVVNAPEEASPLQGLLG
ncbi:MAG: NusG domain II-containing protein [Raoultibacter sp.]